MISRRSFVRTASLLAGTTLLPNRMLANQSEIAALDPLETMVRLRSRTDGKISMAWLEADREIMFDGELYPFCKLYNLMLTSFRKQDDAFIARTFEVSYYCDPQTGELLDSFAISGGHEPAKVPIYRAGPSDVRYKAAQDERTQIPVGPTAGSLVHHLRTIERPKVQGSKVYLNSDEYVRVYPDPDGRPSIFYRDRMIWQADIHSLIETANPDVPSSFSYAAATDLRPWMKLDPTRGHTLSSGVGAKIQSREDLPETLAHLLAQHDPQTLDDPQSYFQYEPKAAP